MLLHKILTITILILYGWEVHGLKISAAGAKTVFNKVKDKFADVINLGLGTTSRSISVEKAALTLREEFTEDNNEAFLQAVLSLTVCDIGGGAMVPVVQAFTNTVMKHKAFEATKNAMVIYNTQILNGLDTVDDLKDVTKTSKIKAIVTSQKKQIIDTFGDNVKNLEMLPHFKKTDPLYKSLTTAQKWMKVRTVAKALGPLFDTAGIIISAWSLHSAVKTCKENKYNCDHSALISSTLGIVSGVVGLATFFTVLAASASVGSVVGPVGTVIGVVFAICATLFELFWPKPDPTIAARVDLSKQLDKVSRYQLYMANSFLKDSPSNVYVVNQGHLATFFDFKQDNDKVVFDDSNTRQRILMEGKCEDPKLYKSKDAQFQCRYLKVGRDRSYDNNYFGPDFYGFENGNVDQFKKGSGAPTSELAVNGGSTILINTNKVTESEMKNYGIDSANKLLRGVSIDVKSEGLDIIAISGMPNLKKGYKVAINLESGGGSAINIDGAFGKINDKNFENVLDVNLADNGVPNTLNFLGMDLASSGIKGIRFNHHNNYGLLDYTTTGNWHSVGHVRNIQVLVASKGDDHIVPFVPNRQKKKVDFTIFKFKGKAVYEIDLFEDLKDAKQKYYKIIDTSTNGNDDFNKRCEQHNPMIFISSLPGNAVVNDIIYDGRRLNIYANPGDDDGDFERNDYKTCKIEKEYKQHTRGKFGGKKLRVVVEIVSSCPVMVRAMKKDATCMLNRPLAEVDLQFFGGKDLTVDFTADVKGDRKNDLVTLKCPKSQIIKSITINTNSGGGDAVVLRKDTFLDPCEIDGEVTSLKLKCIETNNHGVKKKKWELKIEGADDKFNGNGKTHYLKGVREIINEFGISVINLKDHEENCGQVLDLYDFYTANTLPSYAKEKGEEIAKEWESCYKSSTEIAGDDELANTCHEAGIDGLSSKKKSKKNKI